MVNSLLALLILIFLVAIFAGVLIMLIRKAPDPFPPEFKVWCEYLVWIIAGVIILLRVAPMIGVG